MHMESVPGTGRWSLEGLSESLSFSQGFPGDSDSEGSACNAGALFQDGSVSSLSARGHYCS